jgi:(S)-3,5-dihydroxyphenylglycine transaminase
MKLSLNALHASMSDPLLDTMNFLNEVTSRYPNAISFAPGRPYDGFFEVADVFRNIRRYLGHLQDHGMPVRAGVYQYGPTAGQIRDLVSASLRDDEGIVVAPESVVVTVGAQEAMVLALRTLFAGPQDVLLVACPCYVGIMGAARLLDIALAPVPERDGQLQPADVEAAIHAERLRGRRPRALYVVPDHANPSGSTMDLDGRYRLLEIAARHELLILEDSPYRLVGSGDRLPALKALDTGQDVVHIGSYSKTVFPGARVGFALADQLVTGVGGVTSLLADEMAKVKSMITVNTPSLSQAVIAGTLLACDGRLSVVSEAAAARYRHAMATTLGELDRRFPAARRDAAGVSWNRPAGGFFLSLRVPFDADNAALQRSAEEFGVLWTPMSYFYPDGAADVTARRSIRLSVSYLEQAQIRAGIGRLARFIEASERNDGE